MIKKVKIYWGGFLFFCLLVVCSPQGLKAQQTQMSTYCNPLNIDYTPEKWYFQGSNAPPAHNYKDSVVYIAGDPSGSMSILYTENPKRDDWKDALVSWKKEGNVQGHNTLWGIAPDKLYNLWMVYTDDSLHLKSLGVDQTYYFSIEAFNENGISKRSPVVEVK